MLSFFPKQLAPSESAAARERDFETDKENEKIDSAERERKKRSHLPSTMTIDAFVEGGNLVKHSSKKKKSPQARHYRHVELPLPAPRDAHDFLFFVISKARSRNVLKTVGLFNGTGILPIFIVRKHDKQAYVKAARAAVIGGNNVTCEVHEGGGLCESRNKALVMAAAAGKFCVQLSDDLSSFTFSESKDSEWDHSTCQRVAGASNTLAGLSASVSVTPGTAARFLESCMRSKGAALGGCYPN
jgi:hypothetical protein